MGSMTAERFRQGQTYDEFKASMTRNRERFDANEARVRIGADDLAALKPTTVAAADAGAAYGAPEQALLNELKAKVNALAAAVLKTTKAP